MKYINTLKPAGAIFVSVLFCTSAEAGEMTFVGGGNDTKGAAFIQASGSITQNTPELVRRLLKLYPRNEWGPLTIRLNSPGGNLAAAIEMGELFRENKVITEVGSDETYTDPDGHPA